MKFKRYLSCIVLMSCLSSGCAVYNAVVQQPIYVPEINVSTVNNKISTSGLKELIIKACTRHGWNIDSATNSVVQATLWHHGKEKTVIEIVYSRKKITINYKESFGMRHEEKATGEEIHRSYNRWVKSIEMDIRRGLAAKQ